MPVPDRDGTLVSGRPHELVVLDRRDTAVRSIPTADDPYVLVFTPNWAELPADPARGWPSAHVLLAMQGTHGRGFDLVGIDVARAVARP